MKLVVREMGKVIVASVAVALIFAAIAYSLIPELTQYINDTFPSEKNLELISVVAADPEPEHSEPLDGDKYENSDYIYTFVAASGGWEVSVKDKTKVQYEPLYNTLYNKPLLSIKETFKDCVFLTTSPAIPNNVKDMSSAFYGCSSLTGTIMIYANPDLFTECFSGISKPVTLMGSSTVLSVLAATNPGGYVTIE